MSSSRLPRGFVSTGARRLSFLATAAVVFGVAFVGLSLALFSSPAHAVSYDAQEIALVNLVNEYRVSLGLVPLMVSDLATDAAEKHSCDMGTYNFFSHTTLHSDWFPEGAHADTRLAICGYSYQVAWGENIAAGFSTAEGVFNEWKNSPPHNTVMTGSAYRVVGVGLVYVPGSLPYERFWTMDFGGFVDDTAHWIGSSTTTSTTASTTTSSTTPTTSTTIPPTTTTTAPSSTTTTTVAAPQFADVRPSHSFYLEITSLAQAGILSGGSDGLFHPDNPVTRAQFAKIIILALGKHTATIDNVATPTFLDVPFAGAVYPFDYVEEAVALSIIGGFLDGTFHPNDRVTRAQLALMLARAGGSDLAAPPLGDGCPFSDVPAYAREAVGIASFNSLVNGKTTTLFDPYGQATRGQVAKMIYRLRLALGL